MYGEFFNISGSKTNYNVYKDVQFLFRPMSTRSTVKLGTKIILQNIEYHIYTYASKQTEFWDE